MSDKLGNKRYQLSSLDLKTSLHRNPKVILLVKLLSNVQVACSLSQLTWVIINQACNLLKYYFFVDSTLCSHYY